MELGRIEEIFLKSIEINPRYAEAHYRYGWNYLACVEGKFDEAEKHGDIAIKLELGSICYANYSLILSAASKYSEAIAACKTGIELDPNSFLCHLSAGRFTQQRNNMKKRWLQRFCNETFKQASFYGQALIQLIAYREF
jgi:tetratricopeptide (TPR) repeat protein